MLHRKSPAGLAKFSFEPFASRGRAAQHGDLEAVYPPTLVGNGRFKPGNGHIDLTVHDSELASTEDLADGCLDIGGVQGTSHTSARDDGSGVYTGKHGG